MLNFTLEQYIALANVIKASWRTENILNTNYVPMENCGVANLRQELADMLAKDNPNFDKTAFFKACGNYVKIGKKNHA